MAEKENEPGNSVGRQGTDRGGAAEDDFMPRQTPWSRETLDDKARRLNVPPYVLATRGHLPKPSQPSHKPAHHRPAKHQRVRKNRKARDEKVLEEIEMLLSGIYGDRWLKGQVKRSILRIPELRQHLMLVKRSELALLAAVEKLVKQHKEGKVTLGGPDQVPLPPHQAHFPPYHFNAGAQAKY